MASRPLRFEVDERIAADGTIVTPLLDSEIDRIVGFVMAAGVEAVGVTLLHAYANPVPEERIAQRLREASKGKIFVSSGSELSREPREYERTSTTVLNAALMRLIDEYLRRLEKELKSAGENARLYVTHSNGGALAPAAARHRPVSLAQSGPVAGVQSCVRISKELGFDNLIAFDIGGTSTDIALIENGAARVANEIDVGGLPVRLPAVQVYSIGAGGGSIAEVDDVRALTVGPKSARASPGPACYGRGGKLATVTDAHAVLGRLPADYPLGGFLKLDVAAAYNAVHECVAQPLKIAIDQGAQAIIDVINAKMEGAVRVLLRERGSDPRDFALVAFGGAGPLHAVELARSLGIGTVIVPRHPGTFSAFGLLTSDLRHDFAISRPIRSNAPQAAEKLASAYRELEELALKELNSDPDFSLGADRERRCDMRYVGQAYDVSVPLIADPADPAAWDELRAAFHEEHRRAYPFAEPDEPCELRTQRLSLTVRVGSRLQIPMSRRKRAAHAATSW